MQIPSTPSKILMTTDTLGGVWTYTIKLIKALSEYGIEVHLASMGRPLNSAQHQQLLELKNVTIYESDYKLEWMTDPWQDVSQSKIWLEKIHQQVQPDLVHLNTFSHGSIGFDVPVIVVGHSCVLSWWQAVKGETAPASYQTYRDEVRTGLQAADLVVAPSAAMMQQLNFYYGPFENYKVISNGVEIPNKNTFKWPYILSIGRIWDEAKNIQALQKISKNINWKICLAGESKSPESKSDALGKGIHYLGYVSHYEVLKLMTEASIYAHPARYEPFGLTIAEAASAGCALVLGDIPSLKENWDQAALFVNPEDLKELHYNINLLTKDNQLRNKLANESKSRATEFSLCKMAEKYHEAYTQLVSRDALHITN